ncbi:putative quinate permease [Amylocarpus encephaloides]|uniref:Quinate permease n=1 Tax=Amylocarpus encephaloides TaxID=45428 RepID=A0A9P7YDH3_9HELO|nr:putative quinate permease [Amylocarpus encephaloides]
MTGGGGKPQNIFKLNRGDDPKEVLNWRLWFAVLSFGIMGAARGIDEGLISGTLSKTHFTHKLGLDKMGDVELANVKGNISAMVQIGSVGGAGLAFLLCDRIGRLWATRQLCLIWILGVVIFLTNDGRLGQVYAGRFIAGLGIGQTTVVAPVYLSEIAPKSVRGLCTCAFSGSVYIGIMLAYFSSWGSSLHIPKGTSNQWVVPTTIHVMFAGIIFILSFFNYESPRYLIKCGKDDLATNNLARVRGLSVDDALVIKEISDIHNQLQEEKEATLGQGWLGILKEMFFMPNNFYRIYLGMFSQLLSQWSGAQSITIYAPEFFALLGTEGQNEKLFATAIFGVVKFVAAIMCALFLVDVIGRKRSLGIGIGLQTLSMAYIASFLTAIPQLEKGQEFTSSQKHASTGAIVMIYISGFGWAMGWNSIQYLLNAEIYPLRIRAISSSLVMCFHFVNQYGNSRAVPNMLLEKSHGGLGPAGTFWLFTAITLIGGVWAWLFIPETAGRSLEGMDRLFTLRWWQIGRFGETDANEQVIAQEKWENDKKNVKVSQAQVENKV